MATRLSEHDLDALVGYVPALEEFRDRFAALADLVRTYPAVCAQLRAESQRRQVYEIQVQRLQQELAAVKKQLGAVQAAAIV
jgi:hypothetical protein